MQRTWAPRNSKPRGICSKRPISTRWAGITTWRSGFINARLIYTPRPKPLRSWDGPTAFQGKIDDAIAECKKAIQIDPEFGNPYNDIGAYLIERGEYDEAVPWLERSLQSRRYESYHYPHYNLGRVYAAKEHYAKARFHFEQALKISPDYTLARDALAGVRFKLQ